MANGGGGGGDSRHVLLNFQKEEKNMSATPYLEDYEMTLTADGNPLFRNFVGSFFICTGADQDFQMSFDGQTWFKGFQGQRIQGFPFTKLYFRSSQGVDTDIEFFVGNVNMDDTRLSIVHDENQILSVGSKVPATYLVAGNAVINPGATLTIAGGNAGNQRKDIVIRNLDAANNLAVQSSLGITGDIILPLDFWPSETSDTVKVQNPNGAAVSVCWFETYYSPAV
jgi:hypothetical protein